MATITTNSIQCPACKCCNCKCPNVSDTEPWTKDVPSPDCNYDYQMLDQESGDTTKGECETCYLCRDCCDSDESFTEPTDCAVGEVPQQRDTTETASICEGIVCWKCGACICPNAEDGWDASYPPGGCAGNEIHDQESGDTTQGECSTCYKCTECCDAGDSTSWPDCPAGSMSDYGTPSSYGGNCDGYYCYHCNDCGCNGTGEFLQGDQNCPTGQQESEGRASDTCEGYRCVTCEDCTCPDGDYTNAWHGCGEKQALDQPIGTGEHPCDQCYGCVDCVCDPVDADYNKHDECPEGQQRVDKGPATSDHLGYWEPCGYCSKCEDCECEAGWTSKYPTCDAGQGAAHEGGTGEQPCETCYQCKTCECEDGSWTYGNPPWTCDDPNQTFRYHSSTTAADCYEYCWKCETCTCPGTASHDYYSVHCGPHQKMTYPQDNCGETCYDCEDCILPEGYSYTQPTCDPTTQSEVTSYDSCYNTVYKCGPAPCVTKAMYASKSMCGFSGYLGQGVYLVSSLYDRDGYINETCPHGWTWTRTVDPFSCCYPDSFNCRPQPGCTGGVVAPGWPYGGSGSNTQWDWPEAQDGGSLSSEYTLDMLKGQVSSLMGSMSWSSIPIGGSMRAQYDSSGNPVTAAAGPGGTVASNLTDDLTNPHTVTLTAIAFTCYNDHYYKSTLQQGSSTWSAPVRVASTPGAEVIIDPPSEFGSIAISFEDPPVGGWN